MITCSWNSISGWEAPRLEPYGPLTLMPTASVLHYATSCFEGMKLYRGHDSRLRLFRPDRNCRRMLGSAVRIALPAFDPRELQKLLEALIRVDGGKWLPKSRPGSFLYLRPTMIANAAALGVQKPEGALLYIIACCFPSLDEPRGTVGLSSARLGSVNAVLPGKPLPGLKLLASKEDTVRAWPGGFGYAKVGANYGPSLVAQGEARARGFDQILWLLGPNCEVTEAGASNFFVVWKTREGKTQLVTAPLDDKVILDGVTRRSVLDLAAERLTTGWEEVQPLEIEERKFTMKELEEAIEERRLIEAFAAGTAVCLTSSPPPRPTLP
jgi:branched-chain amino acid aminotransferase